MPNALCCLDERVWQLSLKDVARLPAAWNKRTLPRTHEEPCDDHSSIPVLTSVEDFTEAIDSSMQHKCHTVAAAEDAVLPSAVTVDYEIRDNAMYAEIDLYGVFRYTRTPLLLCQGEGNWLLTVPVLGVGGSSVSLTLRAKFDQNMQSAVRTCTFGPQAQYQEFDVEGFMVVVVVNAADATCVQYTKQVQAAGGGASDLHNIMQKLSALVNSYSVTSVARTSVSATQMQEHLHECDLTLCEAREWTKRWSLMFCCDADSVMIHAMTAKSASMGEEDWTISIEDVLESMDFSSPAFLLDDARCAEEPSAACARCFLHGSQSSSLSQSSSVPLPSVTKEDSYDSSE